MPSPFLDDIPRELMVNTSVSQSQAAYRRTTSWTSKPPTAVVARGQQFRAGQRVFHAKFGEGIVVESRPSGDDDEEVSVVFGEAGLKRLLASFANMEVIEG
jgi:DNA helicase-2/ATP-dependent DNA helicase PcrA